MCPKSGDKCLPTDRLELVFLPMANILFTNCTIGIPLAGILTNGIYMELLWMLINNISKERTGHLEKTSNMDQEFFLLSFKWVNCKHRSRIYCTTHECNLFADDPGKLQLFWAVNSDLKKYIEMQNSVVY
jgi:hypothetical protein